MEVPAKSLRRRIGDLLAAAESESALVTANAGHYRFLPGVAVERYRP